jgi:hypothetical protein
MSFRGRPLGAVADNDRGGRRLRSGDSSSFLVGMTDHETVIPGKAIGSGSGQWTTRNLHGEDVLFRLRRGDSSSFLVGMTVLFLAAAEGMMRFFKTRLH